MTLLSAVGVELYLLTERMCIAAFEIVIPEEQFCEYKEGM